MKRCLGPILVQLPPHWNADPDRLAGFLEAAPRRHRWAVEFRDPSWLRDDIYDLLETHQAALCIHDLVEDHPWRTTAPWVYLRFHGTKDGGRYSHAALTDQAAKIRECLSRGFDVYAYFNNDAHGYAASNAADLRRCLEARGS